MLRNERASVGVVHTRLRTGKESTCVWRTSYAGRNCGRCLAGTRVVPGKWEWWNWVGGRLLADEDLRGVFSQKQYDLHQKAFWQPWGLEKSETRGAQAGAAPGGRGRPACGGSAVRGLALQGADLQRQERLSCSETTGIMGAWGWRWPQWP